MKRLSLLPCLLLSLLLVLSWGCRGSAHQVGADVDLEGFPHIVGLAAALPVALERQETLGIDFGTPEGRRFFQSGFATDGSYGADGPTMVWGLGEESVLSLHLYAPRDLTMRFRCRPLHWRGGPTQTLVISVNGQEVGEFELDNSFEDYRVSVPAAAWQFGANEVRLRYGFHRAPKDFDADSEDARPLAVAWDWLRLLSANAPADSPVATADVADIELPFGRELSYFLELSDTAVFTVEAIEGRGNHGKLAVRWRADAGTDASHEGEPQIALLSAGSQRSAVEFSAASGLVQISLTAFASGGTPGSLSLRSPELRLRQAPGAAATGATTPEASTPDVATNGDNPLAGRAVSERPPNVVIYLIDTLRADHLGCYGYDKPVSPRIDEFARQGLLFENALAQSSWTRSTVASVLTGMQPLRHGVIGRDDALSPEMLTLAERLAEHDYQTAAFVTNGNVHSTFGFQQGFETFELLGEQEVEVLHTLSDEVNDRLLRWLDGREADEPFLLYVHTMEPHAPYLPPAEAARRFAADIEQPTLDAAAAAALQEHAVRFRGQRGEFLTRLGSVPWVSAMVAEEISATPAMTEDLISLYDAEIFYNDFHFGALLDELRRRGLYDDTLIIFLADHGEEFGDHGSWSHGMTLYDEQVRIPLIVKPPASAAIEVGRRVQRLGQQIDVVPTVLKLVSAASSAAEAGDLDIGALEGSDLLSNLEAGRDYPAAGFSYLDLDQRRATSLVLGRWKLLCSDLVGERCQLFDLKTDPTESHDLSISRSVRDGYMRARMQPMIRDAVDRTSVEIDDRLRRQLEALGYL